VSQKLENNNYNNYKKNKFKKFKKKKKRKKRKKLTGISISSIVERHASFNEDSRWQFLKALVNTCN
jgi:hypothetical protein